MLLKSSENHFVNKLKTFLVFYFKDLALNYTGRIFLLKDSILFCEKNPEHQIIMT